MIFRFIYAMFWLLLGAALAVHNNIEGASMGLLVISSLVFGDLIMLTIKSIQEHLQG